MALDKDDFKPPKGLLEATMFPSSNPADKWADLDGRLEAWLLQAATLTVEVAAANVEAAQKAYVYWQAYEACVNIMNSKPISESMDAGNTTLSFSTTQIARFNGKALENKELFHSYIPTPEPSEKRRRSMTVRIKVSP